jgi:hypothetical protein
MIVAHGGTGGLIVEISVLVAVVLIGLLAWRAAREADDEDGD